MAWPSGVRVGEDADMTSQRTEPSVTAGERAMLEGRLDYHRETSHSSARAWATTA